MKVFKALYNGMTEESSYMTLSIHRTREGAEKIIAEHKAREIADWKKYYPTEEDEPYPFGIFEDWMVSEVEILD